MTETPQTAIGTTTPVSGPMAPGSLAGPGGTDSAAFESLVGPYRSELLAHCYRMLGSVHDAEDVMQEVLLRAWRGLPGFRGSSSVRWWLHRIVVNACLTMIESRSRRLLPMDLGPSAEQVDLAEVLWLEPFPTGTAVAPDPAERYEVREDLELAFVAALQHLPPNQRAALILRDVLGFSAREAATALDTRVTAVNSALQHARRTVAARVPERSRQASLRELDDAGTRRTVERYMRAMEDHDVEAVVAMLAEDATWSMPPHPAWYRGHEAIRRFLPEVCTDRWRHMPTTANGAPAVACYAWDAGAGVYLARVIDVLTIRRGRLAAVTSFVDASLFASFDLPDRLSGDTRQTSVS